MHLTADTKISLRKAWLSQVLAKNDRNNFRHTLRLTLPTFALSLAMWTVLANETFANVTQAETWKATYTVWFFGTLRQSHEAA